MKRIASMTLLLAALLASVTARAQVAGSHTLGVTVAEMKEVLPGWSVHKGILGKPVYTVSTAIIGAGDFVGLAKHEVAIPFDQLKQTGGKGGKFVLAGATKDVLKAMPKFEYAK